ncbi:LOW QUALITY PROTEIN: uncharacterized protein [Eurosta solidaginis]|uniref:LOW QUALITY PROTEIN: uncharacterized protein n=1 Tax=Eurosta solidaginis TaxID=178769 RepID=UPI0035308203
MDGKILSAKECKIIVKKSLLLKHEDGIKIIDYVLCKASDELVDFMGEYYKLYINTEDPGCTDGVQQLCYFVKSIPTENEFQREECERKRFFHKEYYAYTKIVPNLQKYASAECYYARKDLLVLEDLTASHLNLLHLREDEPYKNKHRNLFLTHLAQLHAASIAWEDKENVNIGEQYKDELFEMMLTTINEFYVTSAKGIIYLAEKYIKLQTAKMPNIFIKDKLHAILMDVEKYTKPSTRARNALLHRDSWSRNIFYKFDRKNEPKSLCIVDFALSTYSPPLMTILSYLYGHTNEEERKQHMQDYLDYYYAEFEARLRTLALPLDIMTKSAFLEECRRAQLPALILIAITNPLTLIPEGLSNKLRQENNEKFYYYMNVDRNELFERVMAIDPTYISKM